MSQEQGIQEQLAAAQAQIQQLSQQLAAERDAARRTENQLQEQLEQQQQYITQFKIQAHQLDAKRSQIEQLVEQELQRMVAENCQCRQTLKVQEATYQHLFAYNPQPMWVYDLETLHFLAVNKAAIAKYGYSETEFLAMTIADIRPIEDVPRLLENIAQVDEGLDMAGIWQHCLRNGQIILVEIVSYALEFQGRQAELVMAQDVTDRIQAEQALRQSEERYRQLVELSPYLIWNADATGHNTYASPQMCQYIGVPAEQLMKFDWQTVIHPDDVEQVHTRWMQSVQSGIPYEMEYRLRRVDGVYRWHLVRAIRVQHEQETQWFGISTDISDRKQTELTLQDLNHTLEQKITERTAALRKSQAELQAILNNSPAKVFVEDLDGRYIFVNQTFLRIFNCQPADILGKTTHEFFPPDVADAFRANDQLLLKQGGVQQFEETVWVNGEERVFLSNKFLLRNDQGEVYALCGMSTDITDRKAMEAALQDSHAHLQAMLSALPDHVFRVNRAGLYLDFYPSDDTFEISGLDTLVGRTMAEVLPPEIAQAHLHRIEQTLNTRTIQVSEQDIEAGDQRLIQEVRVAPCGPDEVLFVIRDICDRKQAELALQSSQQFLQTVLDTTPIGVFWKDRNGVYQGINPAAAKILRLADATAIIGRTDADLPWEPETSAMIQAEDRQIMETDTPRLNSLQNFALDHDVQIWLETNKVPLKDAAGNVIGVLGTAQDVTERKEAEARLHNLSDRLSLALQAGQLGVWSWDLDQQLFWDAPLCRIYGIPETKQFTSWQDWRDFVHRDDIERVEALLQKAIEGAVYTGVEFRIWRTDGELRWIQSFAQVQQDAQGNPVRIVGINQDITDRKRTEHSLQTSENRFRRIFSSNIVGMMFTDFSGQVFDANDRLLDLLGYTRAELDAQAINWATLTPPEHQANDVKAIEQLRRCGTIDPWEKEYFRKDGNRVAVLIGVALFNEADTRCVCVVIDISDRKQAELDLQRTNQELARATRLKDEFLANMSHELRTPLNAILGMAEGMQEEVFGPITDRQRYSLTTIERSGTHLLSLINDVLDVAKIEAGQLELEFAPVSVSLLCDSSLTFVKQQAYKKRLQISTQIPGGLPNICGDERRLRQVLINLLTNAVKFTPPGGHITLSATYTPLTPAIANSRNFVHPQEEPSATVGILSLAIADTGIGISPENAQKLFRPFVQIDSALNRQHTGTGLGLALVKRITEMHGGQVELTSEVGSGSCFTVQLPIIAIASDRSPTADLTASIEAAAPSAPATAPLILLAEDNEANISTTVAYLMAKGYHLIVAKNGLEAVNLAKASNPNLILMDIQMPQLDGLEGIRQIRQIPNLANVPIVALTALAMPSDRESCLAAGADEYISKPVRLKQLSQIIQTLLAKSSPK